MKKLYCFITVLIMIFLFHPIPAAAEERSVFGFNLPFSICYEKESAHNRSWIINGLFYVDDTFANYDISLICYSGVRFYQGNNPGRIYEGIYGYGSFKAIEAMPTTIASTLGVMGVLGYEWRFGTNLNMRFYVEGGYRISGSDTGINYNPTVETGLGFNI